MLIAPRYDAWIRDLRTFGRLRWLVLTLGVLVLLIAPRVDAQTGTGSIEGSVTDESGAALPGVTISASSAALQLAQISTTSGIDGSYRLASLPAGVYKITYELSGFAQVVREDQRLGVGFVATINVSLKIGGLEERLTVVGQSPVVDVKTTSGQVNFTKEMLETIPVTKTMWQVIAMTPGVRVDSAPDVGGNTIGNQQSYSAYGVSGQNTPMIEGLNTREGADSAGFFYDYNAFDEVQIKALGNGAEVATPGTNFVGIVKSGGNEFHGRYSGAYENNDLQSTNVTSSLRAAGVTGQGDRLIRYYDVSADLGGRIVRDRLWFYGAVLRQANDKTVLGYSKEPGPDGIFGTADDVQGVNPISVDNQTLKLSYQAATKYRAIGFVQNNNKAENERDGSRFRPRPSTYVYTFTPRAWKGELQATPSSRLFVNVIGGYVGYWANRPAQPGEDRPGNPATSDITSGMFGGPNALVFFRFRRHAQSSGALNWYVGQHSLRTGFNLDWEHLGIDRPNRASGNYLLIYDNGAPLQIQTYNLPVNGKGSKLDNYGWFIQDTWTPTRRLTINGGVRVERYNNFVDSVTKPQGTFGTSGTFPGVDILTWNSLAPRLGAAYDPTGEAKTVIKATWGLFNYNPSVDLSDAYNANSLTTTTYRWHAPVGTKDLAPGQVDFDLNGPDFVSTTGASTTLLNPDLKQPKTLEASVSFERELAANFSIKLGYVDKIIKNLYDANVNIKRPLSTYTVAIPRVDPGPDGITGNADDGGLITIYDYDPAFRGSAFVGNTYVNRAHGDDDRYKTIEITGNKRQSNRLSLIGSVSGTKNHRFITGVLQKPTDDLFRLDTTWSWQAKASASYQAPYNLQFATFWQGLNGVANQRTFVFRSLPQSSTMTVRLEPFGSQRLPTLNTVNFRASERLKLRSSRLDVAFDVYNIFNANTVIASTYAAGPTFQAISGILPPRIGRVSATLTF